MYSTTMKGNYSRTTTSIFWCDPPSNLLPFEFCANTSLHGLKYIEQPKRHLLERIFWAIAFTASLVVAVILITNIFNRYQISPIITVFDDRPINVNQIPFPAITLCNTNNILLKKARQIIKDGYSGTKEALAKVSLVNRICSTSALSFNRRLGYGENGTQIPEDLLEGIKDAGIEEDEEEKILNITIKDFLQDNSESCIDMIRLCLWENNILNCSDIFQPIQTDFGECCSFNMIPESLLFLNENNPWDKEEDINGWANSKLGTDESIVTEEEYIRMNSSEYKTKRKYPRRATRAGQKNGLSILIHPEVEEYYCTSAASIGVKFNVHMPTASPYISELGKGIFPGTEAIVSITPDIVKADVSLKNYDLEMRNCYYQDEFPLRYYKYYTQPNCLKGCLANVTFAKCGCVEYYMPKDPKEHPLCDKKTERCVAEVANSFTTNRLHGPCSRCYPTCNEIEYKSSMHIAPLRRDVNIWVDKNGIPEDWSADNDVSVVHFYFDQELVFPKLRKGLYGFADLLANVGGILSLCLGFSALSLLEILYFILIRGPVALARKTFFAKEEQVDEKQQSKLQNLKLENPVVPEYAYKKGPILYPEFFYREMITSAVTWHEPRLSEPCLRYSRRGSEF